MFCAGCGTQIQSGLNYCHRCGRRVAEETKSGKPWTNPRVIAGVTAGLTAGVGFIAYIFVLLVLIHNGAAPSIIAPLTFFYFAALFGICFLFLRQGSFSFPAEVSKVDEPADPVYLRPITTAQLHEGFDLPASVTDHTTRTLDEVPLRKS